MAPKKRIRPTASNRKNRSKDAGSSSANVEVTIEIEEGEQREEVEVAVDSEIDEASKKGLFPGGPINNELLVDYQHHLAYRIWNGKGRLPGNSRPTLGG
ncbi:hypothetical protein QJS10_CPA03g01322 [Acorus calamus]|uniref:Uncharacterized protein n=1 Tax=Acorus calamus TaxID=4465 RepID=A0AAV9F670_ACOCL|nr:hypothetical protein QJS10_CPA03g01322 [Acorus calamus]